MTSGGPPRPPVGQLPRAPQPGERTDVADGDRGVKWHDGLFYEHLRKLADEYDKQTTHIAGLNADNLKMKSRLRVQPIGDKVSSGERIGSKRDDKHVGFNLDEANGMELPGSPTSPCSPSFSSPEPPTTHCQPLVIETCLSGGLPGGLPHEVAPPYTNGDDESPMHRNLSENDPPRLLQRRPSTKSSISISANSASDEDFVLFPTIPEWLETEHELGSPGSQAITRMASGPNHKQQQYRDPVPAEATMTVLEDNPVEEYYGPLSQFIAFPSSPCRLVWDFTGAGLIFFDLVGIPMLVFDPPRNLFATCMDWFTLVFWTLNMPLTLLVGFVKDGQTIVHPMKILANYIKTWLLIDLLVVVPDWTFTLASLGSDEKSGAAGSVKLLRILRLVRMVRLLRLLKLRKILDTVNEMIDSEYLSICVSILKMILLVVMINHYIGCMWFAMGNAQSGPNWIEYYGFHDDDWGYQYFTAFHWSITQFTPAGMNIQPQSIGERIFAVLVVIFALVGFSYVVGSITGSLTQLRMMQEDAGKQFFSLRRYLKQNNIKRELAGRIQKYIEHQWNKQKLNMSEKNVKLLSYLSEQLYSELQCEVALPHLSIHPLFEHIRYNQRITANRMSKEAIAYKVLASSDYLFIQGENATNMYILVTGRLKYYQNQVLRENVDMAEDWIAEPVLWTKKWIHLGELTAEIESDLLVVLPTEFCRVVSMNPAALSLVKPYVRNFMAWLNDTSFDELSDVCQGEFVGPRVHSMMGLPECSDVQSDGFRKPRKGAVGYQ